MSSYDEIFSLVVKFTTVRVLLALAANKDWNMYQMDVKNAFLQVGLDREIYMMQQMGFESKAHPEYVCKLSKTLYSLKQAPREGGDGKLVGYCDTDFAGDRPLECHPSFLKDDAGKLTTTVNPDYEDRIQKDQLVLSWINGYLNLQAFSATACHQSAHDV
ncbi:uncharacterized protein LOC126590381 [Malus sylvestris]|uniref:uncharacterized protein LOC126590381 n=1 Tax=Malus sylvestris TaxID=3752 RepID=UPI0021ABD17B|nr:uncharacterized protein LOC126590381 [Malus sylvestris]